MIERPKDSNLVYVVALSDQRPMGWNLSWLEIVKDHRRYFHPHEPGWPREPPTYMGFRYGGKLQSIHFVKKAEIIDNLALVCEGLPRERVEPHVLYHLGDAIVPPHEVKSGKNTHNTRLWCAIDTLLTCRSVPEANQITKSRQAFVAL